MRGDLGGQTTNCNVDPYWFLEREENRNGKIGDVQIKSKVQLIVKKLKTNKKQSQGSDIN